MQGFTWAEILLAVPGGIGAFLVNLLWIEMVDLLNERQPRQRSCLTTHRRLGASQNFIWNPILKVRDLT
jgi:hypothetical protein